MKLPRLQYTYVVFYVFDTQYGERSGSGRTTATRMKRICSSRDLRELEGNIVGANLIKRFINVVITNYKLLSVRIVWE